MAKSLVSCFFDSQCSLVTVCFLLQYVSKLTSNVDSGTAVRMQGKRKAHGDQSCAKQKCLKGKIVLLVPRNYSKVTHVAPLKL